MTKELTENEIIGIWTHWNKMGWVVLGKKASGSSATDSAEHPFIHMNYWEYHCRRRYSLSHAFSQVIFGRLKDWNAIHDQCCELSRLADGKLRMIEEDRSELPVQLSGNLPHSAAAFIEALALKQIDVSLTWTAPETPGIIPKIEESLDDEMISTISDEEILSMLNDILSATRRPAMGKNFRAGGKKRSTSCDEAEIIISNKKHKLDNKSPTTQEPNSHIATADDDKSDGNSSISDEELFHDADESSEDASVDSIEGGEKSSRGVHQHITQTAPLVGDLEQIFWKPMGIQTESLPTSILSAMTKLSNAVCLLPAEVGKPYLLDAASIDPWLMPCQVADPTVFADRDGVFNRYCIQERGVEYTGDAENSWTFKDRECFFQQKRRKIAEEESTEVYTRSKSRNKIEEVLFPGFAKKGMTDGFISQCEAVYQPTVTFSGNDDAASEVDSELFFMKLREICPRLGDIGPTTDPAACMDIITCVIWCHHQIILAGVGGVFEINLLDRFCSFTNSQNGSSNHECHTTFILSIDILVVMRAIVRLPGMTGWKLLTPHYALPYTLPFRSVKKSENVRNLIIGVLAGDDDFDILGDRDLIEICNFNKNLNQILIDEITRPRCVPISIWDNQGPQIGMIASTLAVYPGKQFDADSRAQVAALLRLDSRKIKALVTVQVLFANLRTYMAREHCLPEDVDLFLATTFLGVSRLPSSTFIRVDGKFNSSLAAVLTARIYALLRDSPGITIRELHYRLPILDRCECKTLCDALVKDKVLYMKNFDVGSNDPMMVEARPRSDSILVTSRQERILDSGNPCQPDVIQSYFCQVSALH